MPVTAKTLKALRLALAEEYARVDKERGRVLEMAGGEETLRDYCRLVGRAEGIKIAQKLVEQLC